MPLTAFMRGFSSVPPHDHSAAAHLPTEFSSPRTFGTFGDQWIADEMRKAETMIINHGSLQEDIDARRRQEMIDAADRDIQTNTNRAMAYEGFNALCEADQIAFITAEIEKLRDLDVLKSIQKTVNDRVWKMEPAQ